MDYQVFNHINEVQNLNMETVKSDIYALWQECFHDTKSYADFYFNWKMRDNQVLTIYKADKICSMLHLNPYEFFVKGRNMSLNYIVGVATKEEERKQGFMKILLQNSLCQMYGEHMPFTYLMPAAEAIYLPFGFRVIYEQEFRKLFNQMAEDRQLKIASITISSKEPYSVIPLKETDKIRLKELVEFSNVQLALGYEVYVKRSPDYYTRLLHELKSASGEILLCYHKKQLVGYASYLGDEGIEIIEGIYMPKIKQIFMDEIFNYISNVKNIENIIQVDDSDKKVPTIMTRIVDFKSFASLLSSEKEIKLVIEVKDQIIKENNGVFELLFSKTGCQIDNVETEPEISADIADLTRLFFDRIDKRDLTKIVVGTNKATIMRKLKEIKGYQKIFINDIS